MSLFKTHGMQNGQGHSFLEVFQKSEILKNAVSGRWCLDSTFCFYNCQLMCIFFSSPKPVFNGNRRGFGGGNVPRNSYQPSVSPQHEEIVKYLSDG